MKQFKEITSRLYGLDRRELKELKAIIETLLIIEEKEDQEIIKNRYTTKGLKGNAAGHIEKKKIRGYGPYLYLRYHSGGKLKSVYIGKAQSKS